MQILFDGEAYMMTGNIDQTKINMIDGDFGGELDSGGQDGVRRYFFLSPFFSLTNIRV